MTFQLDDVAERTASVPESAAQAIRELLAERRLLKEDKEQLLNAAKDSAAGHAQLRAELSQLDETTRD